jgi:hypothetical protein
MTTNEMEQYGKLTFFHKSLSRSFLVSLFVFGTCGSFSLLIDSDHFLRCLPQITRACAIGPGPKPLHGWLGALLGDLVSLVCTYAVGRFYGLVDNSPRCTSDHHQVDPTDEPCRLIRVTGQPGPSRQSPFGLRDRHVGALLTRSMPVSPGENTR